MKANDNFFKWLWNILKRTLTEQEVEGLKKYKPLIAAFVANLTTSILWFLDPILIHKIVDFIFSLF